MRHGVKCFDKVDKEDPGVQIVFLALFEGHFEAEKTRRGIRVRVESHIALPCRFRLVVEDQ